MNNGLFDSVPGWEKPKYLAFDIETEKIIPEGEEWEPYRPYGISCCATMASGDSEPTVWYHGQYGDPQPGPMTKDEIGLMVDFMLKKYSESYLPLTWNGLKFDFDVLAEESGRVDDCIKLAMGSVDMMFTVLCYKGFPLGLDTAARGMGLHGKTEGMHGDLVPIMWKQTVEDRLKCLEYVGQDARTTLETAEAGETKKRIEWVSKKGRFNTLFLPKGWLTVEKSMELPLPDTSWMEKPITRSSFVEWIVKAQQTNK